MQQQQQQQQKQQQQQQQQNSGSSSSSSGIKDLVNIGEVVVPTNAPYSNETQTTQPPFMPVAVTVLYKQANPGDNTLNLPTPDGAQIGMDVIIGTGSNL